MASEETEAERLKRMAAYLFEEGRRVFREAHLRGMDSFHAPTMAEHLEKMDAAIREERRAIALQEEAVELQRRAVLARIAQTARLRRANGW